MKKNCKICLVFSSLICFLFTSLYADQATVTFVRGKVELLKDDGQWYALSVGDKIEKNQTITTGFASEAKVEYQDSVMVLGAVTRCTLENLSTTAEKDNVSVFLNTGAVRSKVKHTTNKRVSYVVKTPVAVASVRGTDFTLTANGSITCNEGAVVVYPNTERNVAFANKETETTEEGTSSEESESEAENDSSTSVASTDNSANESVAVETSSAESTSAPEVSTTEVVVDYVPATSVTPAKQIAKNAPSGSIVVGKNQTVSITHFGTTETPIINATKKTSQAKTTVSTAASAEVEVAGSAGEVTTTVVNAPIPTPTVTPVLKQKSKVYIELELPE